MVNTFWTCPLNNPQPFSGSQSSMRMFASRSDAIPALKLNDSMMLQKSSVPVVGPSAESSRPLVLLLSWLVAKDRHISNFSNIYLDRGCDVLVVKVKPMQILLPQSGTQVLVVYKSLYMVIFTWFYFREFHE